MRGSGRSAPCVLLWLAACVLVPCMAHAQGANGGAARTAQAVRATTSPTIDGRLDDDVWQSAQPSGEFVQRAPNAGAPAREQTEVRVAYDDVALYVALRMHDSQPQDILAVLSRRDDISTTSDRVAVFIDSYFDRRTAFMFATTPAGSRADVQWYDDTREDAAWDAVWEVATRVTGDGWTAEFRIPFSQLRFSNDGGGPLTWGLQVQREHARLDETSFWSPVGPNAGRMVSLFGELHGLAGLPAPRRVEVAPYIVSRATTRPEDPGNPFRKAASFGGDAGVDLRAGLSENFNLTATINPDFGQVEADPSVVNLTAFETSYPEKRPFFTEGAEIFRFPQMVPEGSIFYSRRVGRPPQRPATAPRNGFVDNPETTRVLGAMKIAGKTPAGWSLGVLSALAAEEHATVQDSLGARDEVITEPLTHYGVVRAARNFNSGRSGFGTIVTTTHRRLRDEPHLALLRSHAYGAGVDARHRMGSRYEVTSWIIGSSIHGDTAAIASAQRGSVHRFQRPDATHLTFDSTRTSIQGWAGEFTARRTGTGLTWQFTTGARSPGINVNDGGFQNYTDVWYLYGQVGWRHTQPGRYVRSWNITLTEVPAWSFGMEVNRIATDLAANIQLNNGWSASSTLSHWRGRYTPPALRGGPALWTEGYNDMNTTINTDTRKSTSVSLQVRGRIIDEDAGWQLLIAPSLNIRASTRLALSLAPRFTVNHDGEQYIRTVTTSGMPTYIIGSLEQTTAAVVARASWTLSPTASLDVYAQPFVSSGAYSALRRVVAPGERRFAERYDTFGADRMTWNETARRFAIDTDRDGRVDFLVPNPDFALRQLRSNAVLRWDYRPGSTIYLVWAHSRSSDEVTGPVDIGRDVDRLFSTAGTNVVMLKASYWLSR